MPFITPVEVNEVDLIIIYISICLGVGGFVVCFLRNFLVSDFRIPYGTILIIIGIILGIIILLDDNTLVHVASFISYHHTIDIIALSFPSFIFKMAFQIDLHIFLKSFTQILTISTFGFALNCVILALILTYNINWQTSLPEAITLGLITTVIDTKDTSKYLGQFKNLGVLLAGEEMITSSIAFFLYDVIHTDRTYSLTNFVIYVILNLIIGSIIGFIVGKLVTCLISWDRCDFSTIVTMSLFIAYAMFYGIRSWLGASGIITIAVFGITICCNKGKITTELERSLFQFWHLIYSLFNFILYIQAGVVLVLASASSNWVDDVVSAFMIYLVCTLARSLLLLFLMPILSRMGYGLNWKNGIILVWGALKGSSTLILAFSAHANIDTTTALSNKIIIYSVELVLFQLTINGASLRKLVRSLGFMTVSSLKISNMNSIIGYVMSARDRSINVLKMNKLYADAAWDAVREATKIVHPYKASLKQEGDFKEGKVKNINYSVCPECKNEIPLEPTPKELEEIRKEAYLRVLKAKKVSYWRQYEWGMMSKEAHRTLVSIVNDAMEKNTGLINIDYLKNLWKPRGPAAFIRNKLVKLMPKKELKAHLKYPLKSWQTHLYKVVNSLFWEYSLFFIVILIIISFNLDLIYRPQFRNIDQSILVSISTISLILLVLVTTFEMFAVGCSNYMRSGWHMLDVLTIVLSFFYVLYVYKFFLDVNSNGRMHHIIIVCLSSARLIYTIRIFRLCFVIQATIPKIVELLDKKIDVHLAHGYDVGKGFVTGEDEVLKLLPKFVADTKVFSEIKIKLEADRLAVTKEIGILQRNRPTIAITLKTREAMMSVLYIMRKTTKDLKDGGVLDEEEFLLMSKTINDRFKYIRKRFLSIAPCPPDVLLRQVSWLIDDEDTAVFLLTHSLMVNLNYEEILIKAEEEPQGIYVIVSGIARMDFLPNLKKLESLEKFGALPNVDYPNVMDYREKQEDYIVSGNVIGEIGILTGRTYDVSIICESSVQAFFISIDAMKYAIRSQAGNFNGLRQRIWKAVSVRLACVILPEVPTYQSWTQEKLQRYLERSFVPKLNPTKTFFCGDVIEAILLIEGRALDVINKDVYFGPSYIPRTVQKLNFSRTPPGSEYKVEPILLVVPAEDIDEQDLMDYLEGENDMRAMTSVALLQRKHLLTTRKPEIRKKNKIAVGVMAIDRRGGVRAVRADSETFEYFREGLNTESSQEDPVREKSHETGEEDIFNKKEDGKRKDSYWGSEKDEGEDIQEARLAEALKLIDDLSDEAAESSMYTFSYFNYKPAYDIDFESDDELSTITIQSKSPKDENENKFKDKVVHWTKKTFKEEKSKSNNEEKSSSHDMSNDELDPKPGPSKKS